MTRILILNHLSNAYTSLKCNRMRTGLTVLGVAIGIASIVVILAIGEGAKKIISDQVNSLGGSVAIVRPSLPDNDTQVSNFTAALSGTEPVSSLTEEDAIDIHQIDHVVAVAPVMMLSGSISTDKDKPLNTSIIATTPELTKVTDLSLKTGQFIDSVTNKDTAVIGAQLAVDLFGTEESLGRTFETRGQRFMVIGILKRQDKPINYNNVDFDKAAIISLDSGKMFNQGVASVQQITVRTDGADTLNSVVQQIKKTLLANHNDNENFVILQNDKLAQPSNALFNAIAATLTVIATISLIVGGIGIMNIMLVSVAERTREIGIRKAIGASTSNIVWQFLVESLAMSLAGGFVGYVVGYIVAFSCSRTFLAFDPAFTLSITISTLGLALVTGLFFGLYPAIRAAGKDPIEALRQYH